MPQDPTANEGPESTSLPVWDPNGDGGLDKEVYRFLVTYYIYQDQISWSRTQILFLVEAGLLTAAFAKKSYLAGVTLTAAIILIALIWLLVERDWQIRDQHLAVLDRVHDPRGITMTVPPKFTFWRGTFILRLIFASLIVVDILLALTFLICEVQPTPVCQLCGLVGVP